MPRRIPAEWRIPLADGRLLILSGFAAAEKRVTTELATRRNVLVAALADEVCFARITPPRPIRPPRPLPKQPQ